MKNLKKISLISFLACATLAGGILAANTEVEAPVQEQKFYMVDGAQVRVPDAVEAGQEDRDGLRFIAKMTDSYRVARGELENMSVGMFFLPADKVDTINKAAVFGENATYYWDGCGYEKGDRLEIVHKETYAFEETKGDDFLTIKCSLWNLLPETLDREIGAVAYLRVNVGTKEEPVYEYHFAETAQGAKAVSVAQKALLNPADEIHKEEGDAALVESAYINAYLGAEGKEVTYTENVYKQLKNGEYAVSPEEKTAIVKSYNDSTKPNAPNGYTEFTVKNGASETIMFDGSTKVDYYYNYSANRVVIWDGDEHLADTNNGAMQYWNNQPTTNNNRFYAWNVLEDKSYSYTKDDGTEVTNNYPAHTQKTIWEGKSGSIKSSLWSSDGPFWMTPKALPFATDTITFILSTVKDFGKYGDRPDGNFNFEIRSIENGTHTGQSVSGGTITYTLETYELFGEDNGLNADDNLKTLEAGTYKFTAKLATPITNIKCINFALYTADWNTTYYVDNICAESECYLDGGEVKTVHTFMDTIEVELPEVKSTTAWDGETVEAQNASIQYKAQGAEGYSDAEIVNGKATITADASVNAYDVKITIGDIYTKEFTSRRGVVWTEFDDGKVIAYNEYSKTYSATLDGYGDEIQTFAYGDDGKFYMLEGWWATYLQNRVETDGAAYIPVAPGFTVKRIGMWIYSTKEYTIDDSTVSKNNTVGDRIFSVNFPGMNAVHAEEGVTGWGYSSCEEEKIKVGYHYYEFDISDFTSIRGFSLGGLKWSKTNPLYIDNVMLLAY